MFLLAAVALAADPPKADACSDPGASAAYAEGYTSQQAMRTDDALAAYGRCLELDPACVDCQYEIGWSHWSRSEWAETIAAWQKTLEMHPGHSGATAWLPSARQHGSGRPVLRSNGLRVPIGTTSTPEDAPLKLELVARFQNYNSRPSHEADHFDRDVFSPKSARFLPDGSRVYVNSLEGFQTVIYDPTGPSKLRTVEHTFTAEHAALFGGASTVFDYPYNRRSPSGDPNQFSGKPVESELSHDRWMWVPYYRRDFDGGATSPSAVAIIDTTTDQIVRVMPTGPIPKYVAASPDGKWVAIAHWGDNTLGVIDTSSGDPAAFAYRPERLVVERVLSQSGLFGTDRDSTCGYCLRGTVFTPDSSLLLVARMGGGGIAGFDTSTWSYLGTVGGEKPTPRHLVISPDGNTLFVSSNKSGYVNSIPLKAVVDGLRAATGTSVDIEGWTSTFVGGGARTIELSSDGRWLFAASNSTAKLVALRAATLEKVAEVRTDSYTVGLAIAPDGKSAWTTSQGRKGKGGNSVCVYSIREGG